MGRMYSEIADPDEERKSHNPTGRGRNRPSVKLGSRSARATDCSSSGKAIVALTHDCYLQEQYLARKVSFRDVRRLVCASSSKNSESGAGFAGQNLANQSIAGRNSRLVPYD